MDDNEGETVVKSEISVLDVTPDFENSPKGTLRITIAAKGESGEAKRLVELSFYGTGGEPGLKTLEQQNNPTT